MTLVGYFFGQIPFVQKYLGKILLGAIAAHAVLVPAILALMKRFRNAKPA